MRKVVLWTKVAVGIVVDPDTRHIGHVVVIDDDLMNDRIIEAHALDANGGDTITTSEREAAVAVAVDPETTWPSWQFGW